MCPIPVLSIFLKTLSEFKSYLHDNNLMMYSVVLSLPYNVKFVAMAIASHTPKARIQEIV